MKLDPSKPEYNQDWWWVGHEDCGNKYEKEIHLIKNRYKLEIIGGITDDEADYSYDEWALCRLDGDYYLVATSGCSCPSPTETWRVEIGPATLKEVREHVTSGSYEGYTLPKRQEQDFLHLLDQAEQC